VAPSNRELRDWDHTYEPVRPDEALGYATPNEFITHVLEEHRILTIERERGIVVGLP
jgi:hypothetical protein